tara:strand:+ start:629 stop:1303 length:675 start_codon:yes stop_codon:yes gene_type:complete
MKKYIYLLVALFGFASAVNANGINIGVSVSGGVFDASGAEKFTGDHVSGASATNVTKKTATEGDDAETAFYFGSLFVEKEFNDTIGVGLDYVPMSMDSETTENVQKGIAGEKTNKVDVTFENMMTAYVIARNSNGVFAKVGYVQVDVATNENLGTGGAYPDTELEGFVLGVGYNHDMDDMFLRIEANMMEFDDVSVKNTNDTTKSIEASGIEGYGAKISIGRSF